MIKLNVEEYCHDCDMFEADVNKICGYSFERRIIYTDTVISCTRRSVCDNLIKFFKKEINHDKI